MRRDGMGTPMWVVMLAQGIASGQAGNRIHIV